MRRKLEGSTLKRRLDKTDYDDSCEEPQKKKGTPKKCCCKDHASDKNKCNLVVQSDIIEKDSNDGDDDN